MTTDLLFKNFHFLADTPGGVKKLRQLILQLAVQGRLVPQNPDDPPANELLHQIKVEKQRLIKEGKIKKQKPLPEIKLDEVPFELPKGWVWTCFDEVGIVNPRNQLADELEVSFVPMASISDQYGVPVKYERGVWGKLKRGYTHLAENDIVLAKITPCFQNKKSAVMKGLLNNRGAGTTELHVIRPINNLLISDYALLFLKTPIYVSEGIPKMTGSAGQKRVPRDYFARTPFPLPPLPEQHRIVAKVDQFMALCDELEARQEKQRAAHARLNKSALHALTESRTRDELSFNWTRIKDNFNLLFTTPESIQELRSSILQLAVQGRLVPQNPDDEPASVLLEKIREEKQRLIKEGKIKKQKPLPEIRPDEVPYDVPQGWEWCRIQDLAQLITSGSRGWAQYYSNSGPIFITMGNLSRNNYHLNMRTTRHVSPPENSEGSRTKLENNDLLISITGDVGNLGLIPRGFGEAYINQHICLLRFMPLCRNRYFPEFMRSPFATFQFEAPQRGVKNSFRLGDVGEMILPVPPLPEQHRIVAKVVQLMALCDELESSLTRSQADGQRLMQSVVAGLSSASDQPENVQW